MDPLDVLVLGEANPDLLLTGGDLGPVSDQREAVAGSATFTVGGSGAIFACAAARLGLRVALAGVVGADIFGRFIAEQLEGRAVDVRGLRRADGSPTGISVVLARSDDRGTYTVPGTIAELTAESVDEELLTAARHVHVTSYYLQDALRPGLPALLRRVRAAGTTTSLDPNWDPSESWDAGLLDVLELVDLFLPNAAEATRIAGAAGVEEAARALGERAGTVAVKLGGDGALAVRGGELVRAGAVEVDAVDGTGAGDTFDAAMVLGLLRGWPLERSLALANACGALACRAVGGVDAQPTLEEAQALAGR
jgi:sugar/nucleoside kinase (ribokinase family)